MFNFMMKNYHGHRLWGNQIELKVEVFWNLNFQSSSLRVTIAVKI